MLKLGMVEVSEISRRSHPKKRRESSLRRTLKGQYAENSQRKHHKVGIFVIRRMHRLKLASMFERWEQALSL
jgi:hypothetical protein